MLARYAFLIAAVPLATHGIAASTCDSLLKLSLPQTTITMAAPVTAGAFAPPASFSLALQPGDVAYKDFPAFCRVAATMRPSSDSEIKMELWLPPLDKWNGKFMAIGNGGQAGQIYYHKMGQPLTMGYAVASTDTGHEGKGDDGSYALGHPEKVIDFGYRAVHEMVLKSKAIVAGYYSRNAKYSYWNGCSTGGRQGLEDIQRYPGDFDGVIAGAPAINPRQAAQILWVAQTVHKDEASFVPPAKFPVIQKAVLNTCDAKDGVKDGVLEDPTLCKFDPGVMLCKGADCLTAAQVDSVRKIYSPVMNPRTKERIFPGFEPGSEKGWGFAASAKPPELTLTGLRNGVFKDPNWDYKTFNFDSDLALLDRETEARNGMSTNLKPFFGHGGKLIQYHGWSDNLIAPGNSVNYYKSVVDTLGGAAKVNDSYRLFMVPGMRHCRGGDGTDRFDPITALEHWVEKSKAPESIQASRYIDSKMDRTRPLCPYPQVAVYKGAGSTDDAANFACKVR
ncbi:MAG: tannase/feruloyl esterase family alpha/beta hydrolase [Bryobacterales bacterium]|nr:tannase/feruloyl esterase family alpha/beta hydrolase [Bryobacterales bacterium]